MTTEREEFENWFSNFNQQRIVDHGFVTLTEDVIFSAWQARGRLDAERIVELKQERNDLNYLAMERLHEIEALSLHVQVLREALGRVTNSCYMDDYPEFVSEALSTTPNQDEWIRKDMLELEGYWKQGDDLDESDYFPIADFPSVNTTGCTPLYRIKETTK